MTSSPALVLCLSGHDPTGGAGIHADIESCAALGAHALSVITAHTVQDTSNVQRVSPVPPILLAAQIDALLDDCRIGAIKIGLLGDAAQIPVIADVIRRAKVPVVFDPVLRAGGGKNLVGIQLLAAIEELLPLTTVLTPNAAEARALCGQGKALDECGAALLQRGCANVLVTGGDEPGDEVTNTWHAPEQAPQAFRWARLAGGFHGAGCTLASALAALLAQGLPVQQALQQAQQFAHQALSGARAIGGGRKIPLRRA